MQIRSNLQIVNNHCTLNVLLYLQCSVEQINQDVNDLANSHKKDEIKNVITMDYTMFMRTKCRFVANKYSTIKSRTNPYTFKSFAMQKWCYWLPLNKILWAYIMLIPSCIACNDSKWFLNLWFFHFMMYSRQIIQEHPTRTVNKVKQLRIYLKTYKLEVQKL